MISIKLSQESLFGIDRVIVSHFLVSVLLLHLDSTKMDPLDFWMPILLVPIERKRRLVSFCVETETIWTKRNGLVVVAKYHREWNMNCCEHEPNEVPPHDDIVTVVHPNQYLCHYFENDAATTTVFCSVLLEYLGYYPNVYQYRPTAAGVLEPVSIEYLRITWK
jgi:hypothetical protein